MDWWTTIRSCWSGELLSARLICVNKVCSSCSVFTGDRPWSLYVRPWAFFSKHTTYQVFVCLKLRANRRNNSQHCWPTMLGVVASVFTQLKVWPVSNFAQQLPTTRNNMQQGVQTDATCNIQQCWKLLANAVASVCTGLYATGVGQKNSGWTILTCWLQLEWGHRNNIKFSHTFVIVAEHFRINSLVFKLSLSIVKFLSCFKNM